MGIDYRLLNNRGFEDSFISWMFLQSRQNDKPYVDGCYKYRLSRFNHHSKRDGYNYNRESCRTDRVQF